LGRFDIAFATNTLARYAHMPREGHYVAAQRIFGYLRKFPKGQIIIDNQACPFRQGLKFEDHMETWKELYDDAEEDIPKDMPEVLNKDVVANITCFVDADHARDKVTRRSVTGILLLINNTPLIWYSKRQKTVETSTYGSELVAARIAVEMVMEVRYKLRMLGVNIEKTSMLLGDNMSVILNTTLPSSMLKKKHHAVSYHRVRECIAAGIVQYAYVESTRNVADILTKPLGSQAFHRLTQMYLERKPEMKIESLLEDSPS
jgi:hypothetical protein